MLPVFVPQFEDYLKSKGMYLFRMPDAAQRDDDLETYGIGIGVIE